MLLLPLRLLLRLGAGLQMGQPLGWLQLQVGPPRLGTRLGRWGLLQLGRLGELGLGLPLLPLSLLLPLLLPLLPLLLLLRLGAWLQVGPPRLGLGRRDFVHLGWLGELGLGLSLLLQLLPPLLLLPLLLPLLPLLLLLLPLQLLLRLGAWPQVGPPRLGLGRRGVVQLGRLGELGLVLHLRPPLLLLPLPSPPLPPLLLLLPLLLHLLLLLLPLVPLQVLLRLGAWLQVGPPRLELGLGRWGWLQLGRMGELGLGLPLLRLSLLLPLLLPLLSLLLRLLPLLLPLLPLLLRLLPLLVHLLHLHLLRRLGLGAQIQRV